MTVEVFDFEQRSPEWFAVRCGIPTASSFDMIVKKLRNGSPSKERTTYAYKLAGEIITGKVVEGYSGGNLARGREMEPDALALYAFQEDVETQPVGFIRNGRAGASPDALVGDSGSVEIKSKEPHLLIPCILDGGLPDEHKAQCQGQLWVSERDWVDFVAYWPGMPLHVHRAGRDEAYIKTLADEVARFNDEVDRIVEQVTRGLREAA